MLKKRLGFTLKLLFCLSSPFVLNASGFKINEQSLRSIALSSAYVAAAYGADSSYYNPANMGFLDGVREDKNDLEISLTAIYIPGFNFTTDTKTKKLGEGSINWGLTSTTTMDIPLSQTVLDLAKTFGVDLTSLKDPIILPHGSIGNTNQHGTYGYIEEGAIVDGSADTTVFPVPKFFYKSKSFLNAAGGGFNVGLAFTAPSGLAMTWNGEAGAFLKDVMIAMLELSPSISYQWREIIGIGVSPRLLYGMGNFNNTVYVPLNGSVLTNLKDFDKIPEEMVPQAMKELIYQVNTGNGMAGVVGCFVGGCGHYNNSKRYELPTVFNPDRWFGLVSYDKLGDVNNIEEYNKRVDEANAAMYKNWDWYQNEWSNGDLEWRYNNKTCVDQTAICLPTVFNPVPNHTYKVTMPNGEEVTGYKFVNGVNYCIQNGHTTSGFFGCQNMGSIMEESKKHNNAYVNCYTGTFYDFDGNLQTSNPGPCSYPSPSETDENGRPRGYMHILDAKGIAQAFGMGNMDITTMLKGSTKVEQKSNGTDIAFGYRAGVTIRPIKSKNYSLTVSGVYDSPVKFNFKGKLDADTYIGGSIGDINMKADLNLETQLPAQLKIGLAQRIFNLTIELVYEKIWWSGGQKFAFTFSNPTFSALNADSLIAGFSKEQIESMMNLANYDAVAMGNGWKDTTAYRIGLTYRFKGGTILMGSFAYDESPVPQDQIGIPDSTAYVVGGGINIPITENLGLGASATLYIKDSSKSIYQSPGGRGFLVLANVSMGYSF